jgi:hypothetical protein
MKIAERTLKYKSDKGDLIVTIRVFAPERDGNAWKCRYEIDWPAEKWASYAGGFDSTQALILALQKIGTDIYFSEYHKSGRLFWDNPNNGYGFPLPKDARDNLIGNDAKYF